MDFSVLMSVYKNDKSQNLREALESILIRQTMKPAEVILMVDGPISEDLEGVIADFTERYPSLKPCRIEKNMGLGYALKEGMKLCTHEYVARMDSDDISTPDRFEKQAGYLSLHPETAVLGGVISEFMGEPENAVGRRTVPLNDEEIHNWIKRRCPFNHMTVMLRKSEVMRAGNYMEWHFNEDYYLWIRMAESGCRFANLSDTLVNVRVGSDMYARRGGWEYFMSEKGLQDYMLRQAMISLPRYCFNVAVRFLIQVAMPNTLRGLAFQKLFREKN